MSGPCYYCHFLSCDFFVVIVLSVICMYKKPLFLNSCNKCNCFFSLMHLLIPTLFHMKYPVESSKSASPFNLAEKPKTVQLLLDFMLDVLLMPYG